MFKESIQVLFLLAHLFFTLAMAHTFDSSITCYRLFITLNLDFHNDNNNLERKILSRTFSYECNCILP